MTSRSPKTPGPEFVTVQIPSRYLVVTAPEPVYVTQRTSLDVLGLDPATFRRLAADYREAGGVVTNLGHTRMIELAPLREWLRRRAEVAHEAPPVPTVSDPEPLDEADALALRMGLVRRG